MALNQYVVVGRSTASAIIPPGEQILIRSLSPKDREQLQMIFRNRYRERGFEVPIPDVLWLDARGAASSLTEAAEGFTNRARDITLVFAVAANAFMGAIDVELAYDDTPAKVEHEYLQVYFPDEPVNLVPSRRIPLPASVNLIESISKSSHADRIMRAAAQYAQALGDWKVGHETVALAHLFMGIEALKPAAVQHILAQHARTADQLAAEWGFVEGAGHMKQTEFLLAEVRRRILFQGDEQCHQLAKKVSDAFEHGFTDPGDLRPLAIPAVVPGARYLRAAILTLSGVDEATRTALLTPAYSEPLGPLRTVNYLWGRLRGPAGNLAARGQDYPMCDWETSLKHVRVNEAGNYTMSMDQKLTARLGDGVTLTPDRTEVWNGAKLTEQKPPATEGRSSA